MRSILLASLVFLTHSLTANTVFADSTMLNSIVLGVNLDPSEKRFHFPCVTGPVANVVFCGDSVSIEDPQCAATLRYKSIAPQVVDIYCRLKTGQAVVIARAQGELTVDETQDGFGYVQVRLNPAFSLKSAPYSSPARYVLKFN